MATSSTKSLNTATVLALVVTILSWASAFPAIRLGLKDLAPGELAAIRYVFGSLTVGVYALVTRMKLPERRDLPMLGLLGFLGFALYNLLLGYGETNVSASTASVLIASSPMWTAVIAAIWLKERLLPRQVGGLVISFVGVLVISLSAGGGFQLSPYALLVLLAALSGCIYSVSQRPLLKKYQPLQLVTVAIWAGTVGLLPWLPSAVHHAIRTGGAGVFAAAYLGVIPGALGYVTWSYVLRQLPAGRAASFGYLIPALSVLISWAWLGEVPTAPTILGGVLVVAGVAVTNWAKGKSATQRPKA